MEAFIGDYQLLYWYISNDRSCELRVQKDTLLHPAGYGFAMKKNFKWAIKMNEGVLRYRESKELVKLYKKWFTNACDVISTTPKMVQLDINHFGGLIFILCITALVCFPMLVPEHWYFRFLENIIVTKVKKIFKMRSYSLTDENQKDERGGNRDIHSPKYEVNRFFEEIQIRYHPREAYRNLRLQREEALAKFDD